MPRKKPSKAIEAVQETLNDVYISGVNDGCLDDWVLAHIKDRVEFLSTTENKRKYLEMLLVVSNLLWEQENRRFTNADYKREWQLDQLKIKVHYGEF